jgi:cysteine desulfurase/selenocysteine lyase
MGSANIEAPYAADFGPFDGRTWLNAAHQGPLPRIAATAVQTQLAARVAPHRIADSDFVEVPARLRQRLARVVGGSPHDIVLGNSASYGLDVLVHGFPWASGDEIVVVDGDFPANVFPWRALERRGVAIRFMRAERRGSCSADEVASQLTDRTRLFCTSWVNSFTGYAIDLDAIGRICRAAGVWFVINASQALGARVLDVGRTLVDAVTCCGCKWLLGPYGTGFLWLAPTLRDTLEPSHVYWLPNVWSQPGGLQRYELRPDLGARVHDVSGTANFLNYVPWTVALEYLLNADLSIVERYNQSLVGHFLAQIDRSRVEIVSVADSVHRSTLIVVRPRTGHDVSTVHAHLTAHGIDVSLREGALRLSPHLYNTRSEMERAASLLAAAVA